MTDLSRQVKGAIGEHYVIMRLLARGYNASNINFTVKNAKSADILCGDKSLNTIKPIQVKTSFDKSRSFNTGLTHGDFCTNDIFDETKSMQALEKKIVGPWIFVNVDTSTEIPTFRTFILTQEQVIKLTYESEKWYINDVHRVKKLQPTGTVALSLEWLEGKDSKAIKTGKRQRERFNNPYDEGAFEEQWKNLGI